MKTTASIDSHIKSLPKNVGVMVQSIRDVISQTAPAAVESIKYGIPTFVLNGKNLVHFAGYKNHIGFYPAPSGIERFKDELKPFIKGKGTIQFPLDAPLPLALIRKIVVARVRDVETKPRK